MSLLGLCQWLETTSVSAAIRESAWGFPIIESVHALGLGLFGIGILVDLRALNLALNQVPLAELAVQLKPWAMAGVVVMMVSGILIFLNTPVEYYTNTLFRVKVLFLVLVAVNAWLIPAGRTVARARLLSLILWAGVIVAGRLITYHLLDPQ